MSLVDETQVAVDAAGHLTNSDKGAVEAMFALARKIDAWDQIVEWALDDSADRDARPKVPQNDNVSISAYLKYAESLGLTPAGRAKLVEKKPEAAGGKLGRLTSVPRPASVWADPESAGDQEAVRLGDAPGIHSAVAEADPEDVAGVLGHRVR